MQQVARETWVAFERRLERAQVPAAQRPDYHKWTPFYLDFCHKYGHPPRSLTSLGPFLSKLAAKNRSVEQRHQAAHAIKPAIDEALRCKKTGEAKTIFISLSGHGHFDLAAYDAFNDGKLVDYEYPEELVKQSLAKLPKV